MSPDRLAEIFQLLRGFDRFVQVKPTLGRAQVTFVGVREFHLHKRSRKLPQKTMTERADQLMLNVVSSLAEACLVVDFPH